MQRDEPMVLSWTPKTSQVAKVGLLRDSVEQRRLSNSTRRH
jgi:hypothetical protein